MTGAFSRSVAHGDDAVSFELDPDWLSLDDGLTPPSLPQLTVATKRSISNALPRSRM